MNNRSRFTRQIFLAAALGLALATIGCTSYYAVTEPKTGKVYYTTEWETARGGTTRFVDAKSGAIVTIKESEIRKVGEKEFQENTAKK